MSRQSISLHKPNDEWLKAQVDSEEYGSKSEVINDLIRKAREIDYIRKRLIASEQSESIEVNRDELLAEFKQDAKKNGQL